MGQKNQKPQLETISRLFALRICVSRFWRKIETAVAVLTLLSPLTWALALLGFIVTLPLLLFLTAEKYKTARNSAVGKFLMPSYILALAVCGLCIVPVLPFFALFALPFFVSREKRQTLYMQELGLLHKKHFSLTTFYPLEQLLLFSDAFKTIGIEEKAFLNSKTSQGFVRALKQLCQQAVKQAVNAPRDMKRLLPEISLFFKKYPSPAALQLTFGILEHFFPAQHKKAFLGLMLLELEEKSFHENGTSLHQPEIKEKLLELCKAYEGQNQQLAPILFTRLIRLLRTAHVSDSTIAQIFPLSLASIQQLQLRQALLTLTNATPEQLLKITLDICEGSQLWFKFHEASQTSSKLQPPNDLTSLKQVIHAFFKAHTTHGTVLFQGMYHLCQNQFPHLHQHPLSFGSIAWDMLVQHDLGTQSYSSALFNAENILFLCQSGIGKWLEAIPMLQKIGVDAAQILEVAKIHLHLPQTLLDEAGSAETALKLIQFVLELSQKYKDKDTKLENLLPEINAQLAEHPALLSFLLRFYDLGEFFSPIKTDLKAFLYQEALMQIDLETPFYPAFVSIDILKKCFNNYLSCPYKSLIQAMRKLKVSETDIYADLVEKNQVSNTYQTLSAQQINDLLIQFETVSLLITENQDETAQAQLLDILKNTPEEGLQVALEFMLQGPHNDLQFSDKKQFFYDLFMQVAQDPSPLPPHFKNKNNLIAFLKKIGNSLWLNDKYSRIVRFIHLMRHLHWSDAEIVAQFKASPLLKGLEITEAASTAIVDIVIDAVKLPPYLYEKNSSIEIFRFLNQYLNHPYALLVLFNRFEGNLLKSTTVPPAVFCFQELENHLFRKFSLNAVTNYLLKKENFEVFLRYLVQHTDISKERIRRVGRHLGYYDAAIYQMANFSDDIQLFHEDIENPGASVHTEASEKGVMFSMAKLKLRLYPDEFQADLAKGTIISPLKGELIEPWLQRVEHYVQHQFQDELKQISPQFLWSELSDYFKIFNPYIHGEIASAIANMKKSDAYKAIDASIKPSKSQELAELFQTQVLLRQTAAWNAFIHFIEESIPMMVQDHRTNVARFPDSKENEKGNYQHSYKNTNLFAQNHILNDDNAQTLTIFSTVTEMLALTWRALEDKQHENALYEICKINNNPALSEAEKETQKEAARQKIRELWIVNLTNTRWLPNKEGKELVCSGGVSGQLLSVLTKRHEDVNFTSSEVSRPYSPTKITTAGIVGNAHHLMFTSLTMIAKENTEKNAKLLFEFFKPHEKNGFLNLAPSELPPLAKQFIDNMLKCFTTHRDLKAMFAQIPDDYALSEADMRFVQRTLNDNMASIVEKLNNYALSKETQTPTESTNTLSDEINHILQYTKDSETRYHALQPVLATLCAYLIDEKQKAMQGLLFGRKQVYERYQNHLNGQTMDDFTKEDLLAAQKSIEADIQAQLDALGPAKKDTLEIKEARERLEKKFTTFRLDVSRIQDSALRLIKEEKLLGTLKIFQATLAQTNAHITTPHTIETIAELQSDIKQTLATLLSQRDADVQVMAERVNFLKWPEAHGIDLEAPPVVMVNAPMAPASLGSADNTPAASAEREVCDDVDSIRDDALTLKRN